MTTLHERALILAREVAASIRPYSHNSALILDGERDGTDIVQSALAAILRTTELAAKHTDTCGYEKVPHTTAHYFEALSGELRDGRHLTKAPTHD